VQLLFNIKVNFRPSPVAGFHNEVPQSGHRVLPFLTPEKGASSGSPTLSSKSYSSLSKKVVVCFVFFFFQM